ncbi:hypothetical protein BKA70DRAFT_1430559 [Coprinopsis sp. MPI-PUGE-AT-0042]|nr:hypothetical protein BKA70DRAFT_1430559 [Coprinopsis sp. MPI-PUGE-AT-0042]
MAPEQQLCHGALSWAWLDHGDHIKWMVNEISVDAALYRYRLRGYKLNHLVGPVVSLERIVRAALDLPNSTSPFTREEEQGFSAMESQIPNLRLTLRGLADINEEYMLYLIRVIEEGRREDREKELGEITKLVSSLGLVRSQRKSWGFHDPTSGRFLTPIEALEDFDQDPIAFCQRVVQGETLYSGKEFPFFLFPCTDKRNPLQMYKNLGQSALMQQAVKIIMERQQNPCLNNEIAAYVATLVYNALSSGDEWRPTHGSVDLGVFYRTVHTYFALDAQLAGTALQGLAMAVPQFALHCRRYNDYKLGRAKVGSVENHPRATLAATVRLAQRRWGWGDDDDEPLDDLAIKAFIQQAYTQCGYAPPASHFPLDFALKHVKKYLALEIQKHGGDVYKAVCVIIENSVDDIKEVVVEESHARSRSEIEAVKKRAAEKVAAEIAQEEEDGKILEAITKAFLAEDFDLETTNVPMDTVFQHVKKYLSESMEMDDGDLDTCVHDIVKSTIKSIKRRAEQGSRKKDRDAEVPAKRTPQDPSPDDDEGPRRSKRSRKH